MVPHPYHGLWRRTRLSAQGVYDETTLVFWMQTTAWHADLRVPSHRPDCRGCSSLEECSRSQLLGLLQQEGFAGLTAVNGDICEWHRALDYRPTGERDIARMVFAADEAAIGEYGCVSAYAEQWQRDPRGIGAGVAVRDMCAGRPCVWLRSGDMFFVVRGRAADVDASPTAWERVRDRTASDAELRQLADFTIAFGVVRGEYGEILHATLPWLEQTALRLHPAICASSPSLDGGRTLRG